MKTYTYHKSYTYEDENFDKVFVLTQLYKTGVYVIINNDPAKQYNLSPKQMQIIQRGLIKKEKEKKIRNLAFGESITVTDINDFWEEIK